MKAILERFNLEDVAGQTELRRKLVRAGWRGQAPLITFTFLRMVLPLAAAGFAALLAFGAAEGDSPLFVQLAICFGAALVAYYLPQILLSNAITRRQQDIQRKFPDALDLMVICVEAGLSLEAAFARVTEELGPDARAISEEIGLPLAEIPAATKETMKGVLPGFVTAANPIDVTGALLTDSAMFERLLPLLAKGTDADLALAAIPIAGAGYEIGRAHV